MTGMSEAPWAILIVDDDPEVHAVSRLALGHTRIDNRALELLHAMDAGYPQLIQDADRALRRAGRNRVEAGLPGVRA